MKLSLLIAIATLAIVLHANETTTPAPDLTRKSPFIAHFKNTWQTVFSEAHQIGWHAYTDQLKPLIVDDLTFQPCHTVERRAPYGKPYFIDKHLMGMKKSISRMTSISTKNLPKIQGVDDKLLFQFRVSATYVSYTGHFHSIDMEIEVRRESTDKEFRITKIIETCPSNN